MVCRCAVYTLALTRERHMVSGARRSLRDETDGGSVHELAVERQRARAGRRGRARPAPSRVSARPARAREATKRG